MFEKRDFSGLEICLSELLSAQRFFQKNIFLKEFLLQHMAYEIIQVVSKLTTQGLSLNRCAANIDSVLLI